VVPHVGTGLEGELVLEWWADPRKVTLYITEEGMSFVKSWGVNIHSEMEDGSISCVEDILPLWKWLFGE